MAQRRKDATLPTCPRCGATARITGARFCRQCGAPLTEPPSDLPAWQRPAPPKYGHVVMHRLALSCPECGEPMRYAFRKVCRRCGAKLILVPSILHPNHYRVFVPGPRAALYALAGLPVRGVIMLAAFALVMAVLALVGKACTH